MNDRYAILFIEWVKALVKGEERKRKLKFMNNLSGIFYFYNLKKIMKEILNSLY